MKKRVLHVSHHVGCLRDQKYVLNSLGFEVVNFKFTDGVFKITKEISDAFWIHNKEFINSFDYVLTSDTAALSRIFFDNLSELSPKLIVWVCNRFDLEMSDQADFYEYFSKHVISGDTKVRIVASTLWEKVWCLSKGINSLFIPVINPIGKHMTDKGIPRAKIFSTWYGDKSELPDADVMVPFYHNDNAYFKMGDYLRSQGINVYNGTFTHAEQLKKYKAIVTLPDTFCKWLSFETIQLGIPVLLPSIDLLEKLCKTSNYLFNVTGYGGAELLTRDVIALSEWYNPELRKTRRYFDRYEDIKYILDQLDLEDIEDECILQGSIHERKTLMQWKEVYDSF